MSLFKKILLSFFPEDVTSQSINPANIFISLISSKSFFSRVNRRIVENYKLNMFDVGLDSIDLKLGFGEKTVNLREVEKYFAYRIVANFNGYRFFSVSTMANSVCFVSSIYMQDFFKNYHSGYFKSFLITLYLLSFIFFSRMKVFPYSDEKKNYDWFIDVFFEFFDIVIKQNSKELEGVKSAKFRNSLLGNINVFFMLYYFFKKLNGVLYTSGIPQKEFYRWLLDDEMDNGKYRSLKNDFFNNYQEYILSNSFSVTEKKLVNMIFPMDILIRMIFDEQDIFLTVDKLVSEVFDKEKLDSYLSGFLKNDEYLEEFLVYITDYNLFKSNYFEGVKKLAISKFSGDKEESLLQEELQQLQSSVEESGGDGEANIPERLKKESAMVEKLINFYLTFVGGMWVARGDNFYLRVFKSGFLRDLLEGFDINSVSKESIDFYKTLLYDYSKNLAYYKAAFENFKKGKGFVSVKITFKNLPSNIFVINLINQNFVANVLQDTTQKDIKLFVGNSEILSFFKDNFGDKISQLVNSSDSEILNQIYGKVDSLLVEEKFVSLLGEYFTAPEFSNLKDSLYTFDFWLWNECLEKMVSKNVSFSFYYSESIIYGIIGTLRENLFGMLLYLKYVRDYEDVFGRDLYVEALIRIYISKVLNVNKFYFDVLKEVLEELYEEYENILEKWINLDDNKDFFSIGVENWINYIYNKGSDQVTYEITGDDIIWFRSYLKNISYYNKRYLFPKE